MKPWPREVLELAYWAPLAILVLMLFGAAALKWMPSLPAWTQRLRSCPFYLISIPVVTLIAGLEGLLFVIVSLYAYFALVEPSLWPLALVLLLFRLPLIWPQETVIALVSGGTVCVAGFVSFSALKQELSIDREGFVENKRRQRLKGLLFALLFVWTWLSLRFIVIQFMSTNFMHLRIVEASSW